MLLERRSPRGDRDSGAVAVETALVSMLLLTLLTGIVESSFLLKDWLTVSAAARAGARMGSAEPRVATFAQDAADQVTNAISDLDPARLQDVWVYKADKVTGLPDSSTCATSCVAYKWNGTKLVWLSGTWPATSQNACAGDNNRHVLGVKVNYKHSAPLGFFFNNATVSESTVMWIEPSFALDCKP